MSGPIELTIRRARAFAVIATVALTGSALATPAFARGPENIADVAEKVIDAVVNISTTQNVAARSGGSGERNATPQLPPDSPFQEFFDEFFKNRRQGENGGPRGGNSGPRRVNSLGSGFIIDTAGIAVTNNHVIADADEVNIILNDGTKIPAEVIGRDKKTDLALLKFKPPEKELKAVQFGELGHAAARRVGDRDRQSVQPWRNGDRGHRLGAQPRHQLGPLRQLHSDRRGHQSRQLGRSAVQPQWRGGRREHGDLFADRRFGRHRLRRAVEDGGGGDRPASPVRRSAAWLARREHSGGDRRDRREPQHQAGARRAGRQGRRQGAGEARRHRIGRRHRQVRRQGHQGDEGPAAHRCRHAGRQGGRRHPDPQGQGADQEGGARSSRGRREAERGLAEVRDARRKKRPSRRRRWGSTSPRSHRSCARATR